MEDGQARHKATTVPASCFNNAHSLTSISNLGGVTTVEEYAFESTSRLSHVFLPAHTSVADGAFDSSDHYTIGEHHCRKEEEPSGRSCRGEQTEDRLRARNRRKLFNIASTAIGLCLIFTALKN